ncbi:hypothetical protein I79_006112 [Cricetulus griseus]|uniref:Uncharacterized protein n=1 Tax=Cricetulus griseus TaxID=10029 RepID=G3H6Y7_CRIGR|nr:hypothetical protein I79_006112 [Cricetulus griseus]
MGTRRGRATARGRYLQHASPARPGRVDERVVQVKEDRAHPTQPHSLGRSSRARAASAAPRMRDDGQEPSGGVAGSPDPPEAPGTVGNYREMGSAPERVSRGITRDSDAIHYVEGARARDRRSVAWRARFPDLALWCGLRRMSEPRWRNSPRTWLSLVAAQSPSRAGARKLDSL